MCNEEVLADQTGCNVPEQTPKTYKLETGDWGHLPNEPCRFCMQVGKVYFESTEGWEGHLDIQRVRCEACGRMWDTTGAQQG